MLEVNKWANESLKASKSMKLVQLLEGCLYINLYTGINQYIYDALYINRYSVLYLAQGNSDLTG